MRCERVLARAICPNVRPGPVDAAQPANKKQQQQHKFNTFWCGAHTGKSDNDEEVLWKPPILFLKSVWCGNTVDWPQWNAYHIIMIHLLVSFSCFAFSDEWIKRYWRPKNNNNSHLIVCRLQSSTHMHTQTEKYSTYVFHHINCPVH